MDLRIGVGLHVEAVAVLHARVQAFDERVPYLSGAIGARIERNSTKGSSAPGRKSTSVQDVAYFEKMEKLTPVRCTVAPKGNGIPAPGEGPEPRL